MSLGRVVVVGAGLAGLSVGVRLAMAGRPVLVIEAERRAGGQIHTLREGELVVELGAEGFVARSRAVPELCALVGLQSSLVDQLTTDTHSVEASGFVLLEPGEAARRLGFQVPEEELGRGIRSLRGGMGELTAALVSELGNERLQLGVPVASITREGRGLALQLANGARESCAALVLAVPAWLAAQLLSPLAIAQAAPLASAPVLSNVSVNLLYRREQFPSLPAGSGLLFPSSFGSVGLRALSFVDQKFPGRAPRDHALLRLFFRPVGDALSAWSDARFAGEASRAVADVLKASASPERTWVSRWVDALPVFSAEHRAHAAAADQALQAAGVHVTGSAFHGAGVDAAVASAEHVAARLLARAAL